MVKVSEIFGSQRVFRGVCAWVDGLFLDKVDKKRRGEGWDGKV